MIENEHIIHYMTHDLGVSGSEIDAVSRDYGCQTIDDVYDALASEPHYFKLIEQSRYEMVEAEINVTLEVIKEEYQKRYDNKEYSRLSPLGFNGKFESFARVLNDEGDSITYFEVLSDRSEQLITRPNGSKVPDFFLRALRTAYAKENTRRRKKQEKTYGVKYFIPKDMYPYLPKILDGKNEVINPELNTKTLKQAIEDASKPKKYTQTEDEVKKEIEQAVKILKDTYKKVYKREVLDKNGDGTYYPDQLKPESLNKWFKRTAEFLYEQGKGNEDLYIEYFDNENRKYKTKNENGKEVVDFFFCDLGGFYKRIVEEKHWFEIHIKKHCTIGKGKCLIMPYVFNDNLPKFAKDKAETEKDVDKTLAILKSHYKKAYQEGNHQELTSKKITNWFKIAAKNLYHDERCLYSNHRKIFENTKKQWTTDENGKKVKDLFFILLGEAFKEEWELDTFHNHNSNWNPEEKALQLPKVLNSGNKNLQNEELDV